jgi:uncharacterized ferritin-like protein (DUF455 family)
MNLKKESVYQRCYDVLMMSDANCKAAAVFTLLEAWREGQLAVIPIPILEIAQAGYPEKPALVSPKQLKSRGLGTPEGRASLLHAIAHIEFNAINLALDAAYRFQEMPTEFIDDWLRVAAEEAYHFQLVREQLASFGYDYGDFPAHNGLWETTAETAFDVLVRMALVPRTLEARGLDVTPMMIKKLRAVGEVRAVEVLHILLRDEVGHVAVGTRWFAYLCHQRGLNRFDTFKALIEQYLRGDIKGPFNIEARLQAGFTQQEMDWLTTH